MSDEIKERVYNYVAEHPNETDEQVAEALGLHVITVLSALTKLEKEGRVKGQEA